MESKCPCCGAEMTETYLGWVCMNTSLENPCSFRIAKERLPHIAAAMELARATIEYDEDYCANEDEASDARFFEAQARVLEVFGGE